MKKNQQSIDGFTPRRRTNETVNSTSFEPAKKAVKHIKKQQSPDQNTANLARKNNKNRNITSSDDINEALSQLEINDEQAPNQISNKERKLQKKLKKFNAKRSKKGKKTLSLKQFKNRRIVRRAASLFVVVAIVLLGFYVYPLIQAMSKIAGSGNIFGLLQKQKLKQDSDGRTNILIFGTSPKGWDGEDLADSIMVASLNQETKKAYTVSLPRDLWVKHNCPGWLGTTSGKLNESYGCGKYVNGVNITDEAAAETSGQKEISSAASEITGLDIHYVVHANWQVLVQTIDAVGGIDVKVEVWDGSPEMYDVATGVRYKNGEVAHMNGEQALAFSRARGSEGGYGLSGGNFDRERNQQKIIQATLEKINSSKFDVAKILGVANAVGDNVKTTFSTEEYQTLAELATTMSGSNVKSLPLVSNDNSESNLMTTDRVGSASAVVPVAGLYDYSDIQAYISKNTISNDISEENAKLVILNGTDISGLAREQQTKLQKEGYNIVEIDSAPTRDYATTKIFAINKEKTATIAKLESKFGVKSSTTLPESLAKYKQSADIVIVLGKD